MTKIFTAKDYAKKRHGVETVKGRILDMQKKHIAKGVRVKVSGLDKPKGVSVFAEIYQGAWIAQCDECGGAEFVDHEEPIFFCWGCGNRVNDGNCRPVEFPKDRKNIEKKILERPVRVRFGLDDLSMAEGSFAEVSVNGLQLGRTWKPGETLEDLEKQQSKVITEYNKSKKKTGKVNNGV